MISENSLELLEYPKLPSHPFRTGPLSGHKAGGIGYPPF